MVKKFFKSPLPKDEDKTQLPASIELDEHIQKKYPIKHLNSKHQKWVKDLSEVSHHKPDEKILEAGDFCRHAVYLLKGSVQLIARDARITNLTHTDESASYPLTRKNPSHYTIFASTPNTSLLWVEKKLLKQCIASQLETNTFSKGEKYQVEILNDDNELI